MSRPALHPDDVRWSLTALFSGLQGADYRAARVDLTARAADLEAFADAHALGAGAPLPASDAVRATLDELLERQNALAEVLGDVSVYLSGYVSVDAFHDAAQAEQSTLRGLGARLGVFDARATAWIGRLDLDALLADGALTDHGHHLRRTQEAARKQMTDAEEALAAALAPSGGDARAKLHGEFAGKAAVALRLPGADAPETAGLARLFVLQSDPNRAVREAAHRAELELFDQHAVAFAAAMNGVKGGGWGRWRAAVAGAARSMWRSSRTASTPRRSRRCRRPCAPRSRLRAAA